MREIKFRAWSRELKRMVDGPMVHITLDGEIGCLSPYAGHLDNLEIMQFTGLRDKNGKEIYEGDVLRVEEMAISENAAQKQLRGADVVQGTITGFVEWDSEGCDYNLVCNSGEEVIGIPRHEQTYEVIGNIHENPELIK